MRLEDPDKSNQLVSNLQQLQNQSVEVQSSWLNAIKQSVESMHSTVFMKWLTSCYLLEACFELTKFKRSVCCALDILDDFVLLLPSQRLTKLFITHMTALMQLTSNDNVTIRASVCRLLYSIGMNLPVFSTIDTVKLTNALLGMLKKTHFKIQLYERDVILPMSTEEELQKYIPRYVQILHETCMKTIGMVVYGRIHDIPHNSKLLSSVPRFSVQLMSHVQEKRPICYPESQKADTASSILASLLQLPLFDEMEDFDDEDWSNAYSNLEKTCTVEFIKQLQSSIKSLLSDTPEQLDKLLKKVSRKKHRAPKIPDEEDHAKAVESTHRALISLVSILCNITFFSDLITRMLSTIPTLLYITKEKHIPKSQPSFYRNILNDLCLCKGVHRDPNFQPNRFLLNCFSAPLKDTAYLALLRIRKYLVSISPESCETGQPLQEVLMPPFSDIPLELWNPDTAYLMYQQAKQLSMICRRRGNFAFADKDFRYAACQYSSALFLTGFEEEDLLMTIPQIRQNKESVLELLPTLLYYKAKRMSDRFVFKTNRAECWLRIKGMHDRANLDASNAIEEINMMCFELAEMYPIETLIMRKEPSGKSDQLVYRSMLVSDDLWDKNERRIKRAEECYLLEKRQEESYFNEISQMEEMIEEEEQDMTDYSSEYDELDENFQGLSDLEKTREIQRIIMTAKGNQLGIHHRACEEHQELEIWDENE